MSEIESGLSIDAAAQAMYRDCYEHIDLYDQPAGLLIRVGETGWRVRYGMPDFTTTETLELTRGWPELIDPVSYQIRRSGGIIKNAVISGYHPGGVSFNPNTEQPVIDPHEVQLLHAIIKAAHSHYQN